MIEILIVLGIMVVLEIAIAVYIAYKAGMKTVESIDRIIESSNQDRIDNNKTINRAKQIQEDGQRRNQMQKLTEDLYRLFMSHVGRVPKQFDYILWNAQTLQYWLLKNNLEPNHIMRIKDQKELNEFVYSFFKTQTGYGKALANDSYFLCCMDLGKLSVSMPTYDSWEKDLMKIWKDKKNMASMSDDDFKPMYEWMYESLQEQGKLITVIQ